MIKILKQTQIYKENINIVLKKTLIKALFYSVNGILSAF